MLEGYADTSEKMKMDNIHQTRSKEVGRALFHVSWQEYRVSIQIRVAFFLTV